MKKNKIGISSEIYERGKLKWQCIRRNKLYKEDYKRYKKLLKSESTKSQAGAMVSKMQRQYGCFLGDPERNDLNCISSKGVSRPVENIDIKLLRFEEYQSQYKNHVILAIDPSQRKTFIMNQVAFWIDCYHSGRLTKDGKVVQRPQKLSTDKIKKYIEIWNLRQEGKSFKKIAEIAFKDEWSKVTSLLEQEDNIDAVDEAEKLEQALLKRANDDYLRGKKLIDDSYGGLR